MSGKLKMKNPKGQMNKINNLFYFKDFMRNIKSYYIKNGYVVKLIY